MDMFFYIWGSEYNRLNPITVVDVESSGHMTFLKMRMFVSSSTVIGTYYT